MTHALDVKNLSVDFHTDNGVVHAVKNADICVREGGILGLVGESGSGKSVTSLAVLRLLAGRARITNGEILFRGENLLDKTEKQMRAIRGSHIGMVSQNALSALDPSFTIGAQLVEVIRLHQGVDKSTARAKALEALELVALPDPKRRMKSYPHELSGGQRQRVVIAIALSCRPELLLADEPTTALDATVQKQILDLLLDINKELGTSILLVTHDFGVVAHVCTDVTVMRRGDVLESGTADQVLNNPQHPYTQGLMRAVPRLHLNATTRAIPRADRRLFEFHGDTTKEAANVA
ncbi:ABC transporter ATP-binding protein [Mycolicibacterium smegmatis]|uniref:Oligopeptide transporter ATP-binding component n=2 Tax=Mycolicibacterium smegmatis TaxID=1772 RepID=I7G4R5_MYCS2|nr:ABC transporter ATP-binding protein [Mycolicibacterium smegmatis]AFP37534.1 Oligopeptide transporter ATP-binding component [Mycolicibacterium smegmatis MC2 155]AIU06336.1 peptide ABC transporter ATPase [Mycolicibacterium smegmatis MC2 155]AIU12961.1 peptide ABC transporter ATPase [Mycolicibacterium smegmatis]AIU19585.1 peptide ABC transporter ATPase [Mycolicibacterium smegmatis]MBE9618349.1 ABC transporter ATP-binding protein [Mycolicibacterium smegmatis]